MTMGEALRLILNAHLEMRGLPSCIDMDNWKPLCEKHGISVSLIEQQARQMLPKSEPVSPKQAFYSQMYRDHSGIMDWRNQIQALNARVDASLSEYPQYCREWHAERCNVAERFVENRERIRG